MLQSFDLDEVLIRFSSTQGNSNWTIRDAIEGVQIFGGIGSGKTSGSGRILALKYLSCGFGGLVLTAKDEEKEIWQDYCEKTNRLDDLIILEHGGEHHFNFLEYESRNSKGNLSITANIVDVLKTVIRASEEKSGGKSDDPFWESSLDMLIYHAIDLCQLAYDKVSIQQLYNIILTAPKKEQPKNDKTKSLAFETAYDVAQNKITNLIEALEHSLSLSEKISWENPTIVEYMVVDKIPEAKLLKEIHQFFYIHYFNLSEKTRSIVEFVFAGFLFHLLKEPVYSLFCRHSSTIVPEDCLNGKIILLNLPVKHFHKVGRDSQVLFKYVWQRAMEKRNIKLNKRPVFLWADEAQHFLHEYDAEYQATARSSRIATVYISQNLPNYHANMGGLKSEFKVKSFLGTLGTKVFHSNADLDTNKYASDLIGEGYAEDNTSSFTMSGEFSSTRGTSYKLESMVRPEEFVGLQSGGPLNNFQVEAYIHKQSASFHDGLNFRKITFSQKSNP